MTDPADRDPDEEFLGQTWPSIPPAWYGPPPTSDAEKQIKAAYYAKIVEVAVALKQSELGAAQTVKTARETERMKVDQALHQKHFESMADVAVGSVQRAVDGATFLEKASAALAVLYTGIAALLVAKDTPIPIRGVIPTFFFGVAVVCAAYYLAFIGGRHKVAQAPMVNDNPLQDAKTRIDNLVVWTRAVTGARAHGLRAGVLSLAFGLAFMPVAFVHVTDPGGPADIAYAVGLATRPTPTPTPDPKAAPSAAPAVQWPLPQAISPAYLSGLLYQAQLAEFRAELADKAKSAPAKPDAAWFDAMVWLLAIVAGLVVLGTFFFWRPSDGDPNAEGIEVPQAYLSR